MSDETPPKTFKSKIDFTKDPFAKRRTHRRLKKALGRTTSQQRWLKRQVNDPYVEAAKKSGYKSRAAYKLLEINEHFSLLKPGKQVADLGAAQGGWSQVCSQLLHSTDASPSVFALDINEMENISGVCFMQGDFLEEKTQKKLTKILGGPLNGVISDMAAPATGHRATDHIKTMDLAKMAFDFAQKNLAEDGFFVAKVLRGGTEVDLLNAIKQKFKMVKHYKPPSSRADSREMFIVATGFYS